MINDIAHDRAVFIAFDAWYLTMTDEQRVLTMKNIRSTIDVDEFVPKELRNRDLVIEAITRFRENMTDETPEPTRVDSSEVDNQRPNEE
jgi:hypothetical protein